MGRLFWKFFFIFWLSQVVTASGVGVMIWLEHTVDREASPQFAGGPAPPGLAAKFAPGERPPPRFGQPPPNRLPIPVPPIIAGSLVSLVFAALLAWYFARPIRTLRSAFSSVADGRLETRIGTSMGKRNDELADLGQDFDHMASRLEQLIATQHRLLHDVSHELRSPLARLQAAADLMLQQPARGVEFVERIQRDTARMDGLVGELLTLARLDAGMAGQFDDDVDLSEIVANIADTAGFEAQSRRCEISFDLGDSIFVRGKHELLHRAIENVVRNAVRYSPDDGLVTISAEVRDGWLILGVADAGPGVAQSDLATIFEPFVRGAPPPSPAAPSPSHGLGLAITRRVVVAHGGRVYAANRATGGLLVTLELPLAGS